MATTKSKFVKNLEATHKEIRGKRASLICEDSKFAFEERLRSSEVQKRKLERTLANLEDFHPDSTTTLKVTSKDFNPDSWVKELCDTKLELALLTQKMK
jgi:hypothetical protein